MSQKRIALTDGSGRWFDVEKAEHFNEKTRWNGSNHISMATGSQTEHEKIFLTAGKVFIKNSWSQWQGIPETYVIISKKEAAAWFGKQNFTDEEIPELLQENVSELEIG